MGYFRVGIPGFPVFFHIDNVQEGFFNGLCRKGVIVFIDQRPDAEHVAFVALLNQYLTVVLLANHLNGAFPDDKDPLFRLFTLPEDHFVGAAILDGDRGGQFGQLVRIQ